MRDDEVKAELNDDLISQNDNVPESNKKSAVGGRKGMKSSVQKS
jgi:hypothetical protein